MIWIWVIGLALVMALLAMWWFRLPFAATGAIGSALLLGLAGYAMQGEPGKQGSPATARTISHGDTAPLIDARTPFFDEVRPTDYMILSDAFTRKGQYDDAAAVLRGALRKHPDDAQAWVALGNALVAYADGNLSPPARYAYRQAETVAPGNPAPGFFLGVGELQAGNLVEAHKLWKAALEAAPADAPGRELMEERMARFDELIQGLVAQQR